jgi:hypothetical protein
LKRFETFADFYPVYLKMHSHPTCRRLHVVGNVLGIGALVVAAVASSLWALALAPVLINVFASIGHVFFQRNRPGILHYPFYGNIGSWVMTRDILTGKIAW